MNEYATVEKEYITTTEVCRSKFICRLAPISTLDEGLEYVANVKKQFSDARHNCYAIVGLPESNEFKYSDDGEPSGTAGQPMMGALTKNGLYGVACVVTRYFGGIKLGAGRLAQTYLKSVVDTITSAEIINKKQSAVISIDLSYGEYKMLNSLLSNVEHVVIDTQYANSVQVTLATPIENELSLSGKITELTQGRTPTTLDKKYITYKR
ncbi:MAG: YigZ family protein [Clostridia bacterium]|nr:YigZ family protein [Clostridia bacterium]MBO7156168.1 YigZ family protein [Clostridia bacterium]